MAGDWIKVETGTASKAEVLRIAEMLGISRRECMGLLCDYWSWLDVNARTEVVRNLSRQSLDSVLHCPGFAACIEAVSWAEWDQDGWIMRVVNYEHHNSASAKSRAYEQKRKKKQRDICPVFVPDIPDKTGTREEKRREEIKAVQELGTFSPTAQTSDPKKPRNGNHVKNLGTRLPDGWFLPDDWKAWAVAYRPDWDEERVIRESLVFRDYWYSKPGKDGRKAHWLATWRNWVRRTI